MSTKQAALFSTSFLQYSQTFVYDELRYHDRYKVDVFCNERHNSDQFPYERVYHPPENKVAQGIYRNLGYWPGFASMFRQTNYSLIHAHFGTGAVYALPYAKKFNLPLVVTFWGNDVSALMGSQRYLPSRWRYILTSSKVLDRADLILAVSDEMKQILEEHSGYRNKIKRYAPGVDTQKFKPIIKLKKTNNPLDFLMIGRFVQKKGHIYALKAFQRVIESGRVAKLSFIGDGPLKAKCQTYVQHHQLTSHVRFMGRVAHDDVARKLAASDVLLVPSIVADNHDREGSPTVVKEAGACGIPVIGSYHAGIWETVVDGKTGYLVPERDVKGLAHRMITLIDQPRLIKSLGEQARQRIEKHFDAKKQVANLENLYDLVAE